MRSFSARTPLALHHEDTKDTKTLEENSPLPIIVLPW